MIGSIGWLIMRGIISRMNSRKADVRKALAARIRNDVWRMPRARIPRCATAPATAPQAVA